MLKKIITYSILILILCVSQYSFAAAGNCKIKNSTPNFLKDYIKDSRKLISNITGKASSNPNSENTVPGILNFNIHPRLFFDEINFKIENLKNYELPKPLKRDVKLLEEEIKKMHRHIKSAEMSKKSDSRIKDICSGINNCNIDTENNNVTAGQALSEVVNNIRKINTLMQYTIQNKQSKFNEEISMGDLSKLKDDFREYYNNSIKNCSEEKGETLDNVRKAIGKASKNDKTANIGIKAWEEAVMLLKGLTLGIEKDKYETEERKLLREELSKKGISKDMSESLINNLDDYNGSGQPTTTSNYITNTFKSARNSITNKINGFQESINQLMGETEESAKNDDQKSIPVTGIEETKEKVDSSENSKVNILEKYKKQLPLTQTQDLETDKTLNKIIDMHIKMGQTINTLNKLCPIAVKVCNSQGSNWGVDCGDCN